MASAEYIKVLTRARNAFKGGVTKNVAFRIQQLKNMYRMLEENEKPIAAALAHDLGKPRQEAIIYEVEFLLNDIRCMQHNIKKWVKPLPTDKNLITLLDETFVQPEPFGVVLVLGAWNYPIQLSLSPMIGAITAGNCVILKPSELAPKTAEILETLIPKYLDNECYHVVNGGPEETAELMKNEFDYVFYTGSTRVGQIVREAANKHLTPCTLELGGKSPVYFDSTVNFDVACRRLLWGKFINAGQTCVAPDFVLCTKDTLEKLIPAMKKVLKEYFGENPKNSPDLGRILNERHFNRLLGLMKDANVAIGGDHDISIKYIAPTVMSNVKLTDPVMQDEIFGPLLPIVTVESLDEAIDIINSRDKALTLNIYSKNPKTIRKIIEGTSSGSVCVNDSIVNLSIEALPFGGVGKSGMGAYHGKYSFDTFSHKKAVLIRNYSMIGEKLGEARYPPYSESGEKFLRRLLKNRPGIIPSHMDYVGVFLIGFASAIILKVILHFAGVSYF
ncbi:aldehyde dehydrogenase, dimeric NADP-preferring [Parasteatoda tepidariorum]|uniref:aldehyde dehydrogenase, dimeric NADP-preferring n=1 Tax=Parasteatoda tepidariorum TaxID=114398 RepID=UPI000A2C05DB|nr:aldehyde dehydrogenase, dimeric NADP-preferring-like [Parasteatoda tepidariorum]XP_042912183.1 aldehyde dehydrogenase, dimeric NADP-preferring [Parasteatoda tepidariorum]XP_042912184.1 aldehyde dehydrogenase, dimeric NADP-preferring [Parasteatoda tepidariorum]